MSGIRSLPNPWLADHVIFFASRWIAWAVTLLWLLPRGPLAPGVGWALLATALLNVPATLLAQAYLRVARRNPPLLLLDIFYAVAVLRFTGGWESGFALYAYSSLVLPALIFGWRGGVMAGLTFVTVVLGALWAAGTPPADRIFDGAWSGATLALTMAAPPLFGALLPTAVESLRAAVSRRRARRRRGPPAAGARAGRPTRAEPPGFASLGARPQPPRRPGDPLVQPLQLTRTVEPGVDDLRRVVFAPLPVAEMDLAAAIELLASRFGQHTGTATRVIQLGRPRSVELVQRELLVRLVREALLNIHQHAHASSAALTLRYDAQSVALLVQDDGVGLLDGTYERPGLHALRAMQYRLAEHGGRLDVFESEGGGVTLRATMPIE